jgi:hypothetical protein
LEAAVVNQVLLDGMGGVPGAFSSSALFAGAIGGGPHW